MRSIRWALLLLVLCALTAQAKPPTITCDPGYTPECVEDTPTPAPIQTATALPTAAPTVTPLPVPTSPPSGDEVSGGWGSDIVAGDNSPVCRVTTLTNSGTGSLRDCLKSNTRVEFAIAGTIQCSGNMSLASNLTVDGLSAPSPGITIRGCGLAMANVSDVRVRGIRIRAPGGDTVQVGSGASSATRPARRVHLSHLSVDGCGDGNIDITDNSSEVTVDYSILSNCAKNSLVKYDDPNKITMHHNLFVKAQYRNPWLSPMLSGKSPSANNLHFENNVVWGWGDSGGGIGAECGAKLNVENSMFKCVDSGSCSFSRQNNGIIYGSGCTIGAQLFSSGNLAPGASLKAGNTSVEFPRPSPDLSSRQAACEGANEVLAKAGARPLDSIDTALVAGVHLGCN